MATLRIEVDLSELTRPTEAEWQDAEYANEEEYWLDLLLTDPVIVLGHATIEVIEGTPEPGVTP